MTFDWSAHYDDAGEIYYYNDKTEESSWDPPEEGFNPPPEKKKWSKLVSETGEVYYCDEVSGETQWEKPDDFQEAEEGDQIAEESADAEMENQEDENNDKEKEEEPSDVQAVDEPAKDVDSTSKEDTERDGEVGGSDKEEAEGMEVDEQEPADDSGQQDAPDSEQKEPTWTKLADDEGNEYYSNSVTGETQWEKPNDFAEDKKSPDHPSSPSKPVSSSTGGSQWTKVTGDDGNEYYYNSVTEESQWEEPAGYVDETKSPERPESPKETTEGEDTVDKSQKSSQQWTKVTGEDGNEYYYNSITEESQWEKPDGFVEESNQEASRASSPANAAGSGAGDAKSAVWAKYQDDEGREYYSNETTGETQWEKPSNYVEPSSEKEDDSPVGWSKLKDDEGREYYYNQTTGETQWERPSTETEAKESDDAAAKEAENEEEEKEPEPEPEPEPEIDPAVKRLQDAEKALNQPDAVMEPSCFENVTELISSLGGSEGGQKAMQSLVTSFHGQTATCGMLGQWLADLKSADVDPSLAAGQVHDTTQGVINKIAKERFTNSGGDKIFELKKAEAGFLEEMIESNIWRKLLIDLSAAHRDSTLLSYCLSSISKRGHHREIAKRINQSDHFAVYNGMLSSEFAVVGNGGEAMGMRELLEDLRRTCTSTSYTYLYAVEVLRNLVYRAEEKGPFKSGFVKAIRKWIRLREELEAAMMDSSISSKTAGASTLHRKRRRDLALTVSELHQRQRRRLRPDVEEGDVEVDEKRNALETALSKLLSRHSEKKKFDDHSLDQLLLPGSNTKEVGKLLNQHPLAIKGLLGHLFLPRQGRISSLLTRTKCARLISLASLAAESSTKAERGFQDPAARQAKEEKLKSCLLSASQMCEIVENMVSFTVTSKLEANEENPSAGVKLSVLANSSATVAQGVVLWIKTLTSDVDFANSPSYPTLSPSLLSLLRVISMFHPFTRPVTVEVALLFLSHSNRELSYQKLTELKQQALRLLILMVARGEVCSVFGSLTQRINSGAVVVDASLLRYFVSGLLQIIGPPCSPVFVTAFGHLLLAPKCTEALNSEYFSSSDTGKLTALFQSMKESRGAGDSIKSLMEDLEKAYGSS